MTGIRQVGQATLIKVTQWLAWAAEFLNILKEPVKGGSRGKGGRKTRKLGEKKERKKKKNPEIENRHTRPPSLLHRSPHLPAFPKLGQSESALQPFPQSVWWWWWWDRESPQWCELWGCLWPQSRLPYLGPRIALGVTLRERRTERKQSRARAGPDQSSVSCLPARPRAAPRAAPLLPEDAFGVRRGRAASHP